MELQGKFWEQDNTPNSDVPYIYKAKVIRVVDGDTVDLEVDLGFNITIRERFRLTGIDAPEPRGESKEVGKAATDYLKQLLLESLVKDNLLIITNKDDSFGRWIAALFIGDACINDEMVASGHAVYKEY